MACYQLLLLHHEWLFGAASVTAFGGFNWVNGPPTRVRGFSYARQFVPRFLQSGESGRGEFLLHQHVVGVVGRDRKDGNAIARQRLKESSTPVCENGNGPSSLRQIQRRPAFISSGTFSIGQTIESSSAVRVMEVNSALVTHSGMATSGASRTMMKVPASWLNRNMSSRKRLR
jgi:hypothetical protein